MATEITMPQLSDTMDKGTIVSWFKKEGDTVARGDALAEVATDKANLEIESFHEGTLLQIRTPEGTSVKVGEVIAVIGAAGEAIPAAGSAPSAKEQQQTPPEQRESGEHGEKASLQQVTQPQPAGSPAPQQPESERLKISPLARNVAKLHGVDPSAASPTGEGGRIVKRDIEKLISQPAAQPAAPRPAPSAPAAAAQQLSRMREAIASNMVLSKTTIPHFYMTSKAEVDKLLEVKDVLKQHPAYEGLTVNHLIIRAAAAAITAVPKINYSFKDGRIIQNTAVNIGVVTALEDGLLIPVLHDAGSMAVADITAAARALVQRARAGRPKADDLVGGTFTISNVGAFDVESFSAVIFPGQGAVLAVSGIQEEAVASHGSVYPAQVMRFTLSADHRIIDGVVGAQFLTELVRLIENPVLLLA